MKLGLGLGLGGGGGVVLICSLVLVWFIGICKGSKGGDEEDNNVLDEEDMDDEFERGMGPKKFSYKELARATDNFNDEHKLGQGGFGLWCAHPDENLRPSIRQATQVLNFQAPLPVLPPKMPMPTYLIPSANPPISVQSLTYGSGAYSDESHNQSSSYSYNTNSSQITSSGTSSPSAALLNTR
ncbi:hypothetical protein Q3G72_022809 [Acer saccharum]|nr:hypothetical protein Q3G72_022809 [Acer saccharum]